MRFWFCLILAACRADSPPPVAALPEPARPVVRPAPPHTGAHSAEIVALSVTADGDAVASADRLGGIRLWTSLEGTREPVVIQGTAPRAIAVVRDGDGYTIGTLDSAGGVHVIRTSAAGAVRARVTVTRAAREIDAIGDGLLVLGADQTIELVDPSGAVRSRLVPDAGTHIDAILVRGRRALALIQDGRQLHGRWIVLDGEARWGAATPALEVKLAHAVLSPDGQRLAVSKPRSLHPVLVDLATGKPLPEPLCVTRSWPDDHGLERQFLRGDHAPAPLGFVGSTTVACSVVGSLVWWSTKGLPEELTGSSFAIGSFPVALADGLLVAGVGPNLAIATPSATRFLGYGAHDVAQMRVADQGVLVTSSDQQSLVLDTSLRERARLDTSNAVGWYPHMRLSTNDAVMVDDRWAIVAFQRRYNPHQGRAQIAVLDGVTRKLHQLLPYDVHDPELSYEPTTGLLATSDGAASLLVRFDPRTHTFGAPARFASAISATKLVAVDPGQTGGVAALAIDTVAGGLLIGELHLDDVKPGALIQPRTTHRVPGELRAVDRAGRVYTRVDDDVVIYSRGVAGARLADVGALTLRPSADGSRIAAFATPRLVMLSDTGEVRWDASHWNSQDVAWLSSGELVMQFPSAVAKVDLATGALAERRCGLAFGLSEQMQSAGQPGPSICEVAR
jgi:hypothetical protein